VSVLRFHFRSNILRGVVLYGRVDGLLQQWSLCNEGFLDREATVAMIICNEADSKAQGVQMERW